MNKLSRALLPTLIASALAATAGFAQDSENQEVNLPGLYVVTDEGRTYLQKDDKVLEMKAGEAGFADEDGFRKIDNLPSALDWPCSGVAAMSRKFATYPITDLQTSNRAQEVVDRYFKVPEVIEPIPNWIDGEFHEMFAVNDLLQFSSPDYWYHLNPDRPFLDKKRPTSLMIALFVGTTQVIIDNNALDHLRELHGDEQIPVTFVFNDSNTVPISYFGDNVSLEEVFEAFMKRGIKVADVPMWWLGDYALTPTREEFERYFEIPPASEIDQETRDKLTQDLAEYGFTRKPIIVSILAEAGTMVIDQPQRVSVAFEMGFTRIPTAIQFVEADSILARCGPGTPVGFSGVVSGETTPPGGGIVPPGVQPPPPPEVLPPPIDPEEPASPS